MDQIKDQQNFEPLGLQVADNITSMLAYWDKNLICRYANAAYLHWFGKTKEEMVDRITMLELLGPLFEKNLPYIQGALAGKAQTFERAIPLPTGGVGFTLANYFPDIVNNQVRGFFVNVTDISALKALEKEREKTKELEIKNRDLEQFAYVASHDLQEPLRTIRNYIAVIKEDYAAGLDDTAIAYLNTIDHTSNRLSGLIKSLYNFSKLRQTSTLTTIDTGKLVNEVLSGLSALIGSTGAKVTVGHLPHITGYETELSQLFQNLIVNGIKYRQKDVVPHINIDCKITEAHFQFQIADNGIGIESKFFDRIFNIFQRLHDHETYEGSGIGLALCKRIVELHGGTIWVESIPGMGSTFYFNIPRQKG